MQLSNYPVPHVTGAALAAGAQPALAQQKLVHRQERSAVHRTPDGCAARGPASRSLTPQVAFDTAKLAASKITFTVDTGSATLGSKETDAELPKADWFNVPKFPQATLDSSAVKALGGGKYQVAGTLTIKGNSPERSLPVTLTQYGTTTTATGTLPLKRLNFKIGEATGKTLPMVADEVNVQFKLALTGVDKI